MLAILRLAIFASLSFAHGAEEHFNQTNFFVFKFPLDPMVLVFAFAAAFYTRSLKQYNHHAVLHTWQKASFFCGIALLIVASLPPIDTYADQLFSAHMLQHMIITSAGVPLALLGSPFYVMLR